MNIQTYHTGQNAQLRTEAIEQLDCLGSSLKGNTEMSRNAEQKRNKTLNKCCHFIIAVIVVIIHLLQHNSAFADNVGERYFYCQLDPVMQEVYDFILTLPHETADYCYSFEHDLSQYYAVENDSEDYVRGAFMDVADCLLRDMPEQTA